MAVTENITKKNKIFIDINNNKYGSFQEYKAKSDGNSLSRVAKQATGNQNGKETQGEAEK